jgi:hypothetical protein
MGGRERAVFDLELSIWNEFGTRRHHAAWRPCKEAMMDPLDQVGAADEVFDYEAEAELFSARSRKSSRQASGYKRFDRAADAIRFAIEDLPPEQLLRAHLQVEESRFDGNGIRRLYDAAAYPLTRRDAGSPQ